MVLVFINVENNHCLYVSVVFYSKGMNAHICTRKADTGSLSNYLLAFLLLLDSSDATVKEIIPNRSDEIVCWLVG